MLRVDFFGLYVLRTPLVTFWGYIIANEVKKICQINLLGGRRQFEGVVAPVRPVLAMCLYTRFIYVRPL